MRTHFALEERLKNGKIALKNSSRPFWRLRSPQHHRKKTWKTGNFMVHKVRKVAIII